MILTCPSCDTRYSVDAAKFPAAGRNVRCAKCGHSWHQAGEAPALEPGQEAEQAPTAAAIVPDAAPEATPEAANFALEGPSPARDFGPKPVEEKTRAGDGDRKSTRLNSSHGYIP